MNLLRSFAPLALLAGLWLCPAMTQGASPSVTQALPRLKKVDYLADPAITDSVKQAGSQAIDEWMNEFLAKHYSSKRYVLVPISGDVDNGYFTLQARNQFTNHASGTDYSLYTRDDDESKSLLAEIRKGDQEGDTMDPLTVQKFGRVQGVQGIIHGRVAGVFVGAAPNPSNFRTADEQQVLQVRILLQAFEVETGRLLWGAEKTGSILLQDDSMMLPGTKRQWVLYGAGALVILLVIAVFLRSLKSAHRPR